jgi:L-aspartate oxidase
LKENGLEPYKDLIPVEPAAHYFIGGIATDVFGRTALENLYAVGECANTGFHGANRLASNSLLECLVFGNRAAYGMYRDWRYFSKDFSEVRIKMERVPYKVEESFSLDDVKRTMWEKVGIFRSANSLMEAIEKLSKIAMSNSDWTVRNGALLGLAISVSAMRREESRGGHYRTDFPYEREEFRKHSTFSFRDLVNLL